MAKLAVETIVRTSESGEIEPDISFRRLTPQCLPKVGIA
jgi:hypothetical protein